MIAGRIKIPPEAVIPLALATIALLVLIFAGTKLAEWKKRSPDSARRFGLVVAAAFTMGAVFFLARCLLNQSDPNNEGIGQITFTDAPTAGGLAALAAAFYRMADLRPVALLVGGGIGALMISKPFLWPVIRVTEYGSSPRDMMDPEHIMFFGPGVTAIIVALICLLKGARASG